MTLISLKCFTSCKTDNALSVDSFSVVFVINWFIIFLTLGLSVSLAHLLSGD